MPVEIFISYRRDDASGYSGRLYDRLIAHFGEGAVFRDYETIKPGRDFSDVINQTVRGSRVLLVLIGKRWLDATDLQGRRRLDQSDDFVSLEIAAGIAEGLRIVPVLLENERMPMSADLPDALTRLCQYQAFAIHEDRFDDDVNALVETVRGLLKESRLSDPEFVSRRRRRRLAVGAAGVAGIVAVSIGAAAFWVSHLEKSYVEGLLKFQHIERGTFFMGCVPGDQDCFEDEKPRHEVELTQDFCVGQTEVTVDQYEQFASASPDLALPHISSNPGWRLKDHPIVNVRWDEAQAFCGWAGGRLPTEAEWEYAARGGKLTQTFPWTGGNPHDQTNLKATQGRDTYDKTAPVTSFPSNEFGLYDVAGNVGEWVGDSFDTDYYKLRERVDPEGPQGTGPHVVRGGTWQDTAEKLRLSYRWFSAGAEETIGFRCVRTLSDGDSRNCSMGIDSERAK